MHARALAIALFALGLTGCFGGGPQAGSPPSADADAPTARASAKPTPPEQLRPPAVATPAPPEAYDVIVLTLDTTRADHLGAYGYPRPTSPTFDRLAARGVLFERLVVPQATTLPTHTSLFTGVWPLEHGITANLEHGGQAFLPSASLRSFAEVLTEAGYQTGGFTSCAPLDATTGIERGFQVFAAPSTEQRPGRITADDALAWLGQTAPTPLMMWVHFYDPHNPWNPAPEHRDAFKDDLAGPWIAERQIARVTQRPTGEEVRAVPAMNAYDAEIRTMDDQIARIVEAVERRGRADKTVWVLMGDHGEGLNQHGEPGHGLVWDEQLHAPLLLLVPGQAPRRVATTVSAVDVLPTLLGMIDLPGEAALRPQLSGRDVLADGYTPRAVLSLTSARQVGHGRAMQLALTDDAHKCVWEEGTDTVTVYDRRADPYELKPVDAPAVAASCLSTFRQQTAEQRARAEAIGAGRTAPMDEARRQMLLCLGYLDGDAPPPDVCRRLQQGEAAGSAVH
jgi:arylsulfatase A-like enzyme